MSHDLPLLETPEIEDRADPIVFFIFMSITFLAAVLAGIAKRRFMYFCIAFVLCRDYLYYLLQFFVRSKEIELN